jgi:Kef-type K+ transport system membrane component KefB
MVTPELALWFTATPANHVLLMMFVVFASAKLLAEAFHRLHQPPIVGEILAGIVIGPSVLNWIQPSDVLQALADLGVIFLLFRVGLEVKASELMRVGGTALAVAALGVAVPFSVGWLIVSNWGQPPIESLFVAAAMVATSVGITAQVLAGKGLLSHAAGQIILAAAVIDDVLGLIVLAIVSSLGRGSVNVVELVATSLAAIAFTAIAATWGSRTMTRLLPGMQRWLSAGDVQFNLAMLVLFGLALLATAVGVAAIIGAFLAGMALSDSLDRRVHDLSGGVSELLTPFFLAGIGLHLDVAAFGSRDTLLLSAAILGAAIVTKMVGCGIGALSMGWRNALRVGAGMVPRGEVGMVVAQIGLGLGVIPARIYAVVVFMAIATTLIAPALLALTFRGIGTTEASASRS